MAFKCTEHNPDQSRRNDPLSSTWERPQCRSTRELEIYRRSARERTQRRQKELAERQQRAWEVARQAAELFIEVNLAPIEDVRPELRAVIDREGVEL